MLACAPKHLSFQALSQSIPFYVEVVAGLEVQPEAIRGTEITRETESCIRGHRPLAMHDLVDATRRHADVLRQAVLAEVHRLKELREEDLPWMDWW